ncbi:class II glutamine amidotransferase [Amnibacterium sp. CER49]|uniref:class II glutamine amidotransferase n=1 Tax=Amnibacterium sp. CER49 TaxID=3039161 RepID=UPI00244CD844|nr:class II glutamine amidotransferase [Amnibacterium sp. CER49]MDH2444396.1 class II glutamine amidotransferase [Amnibacterium sp. CER49]
MCRLLGLAARTPTTVTAALGRDGSAVFRSMARLHRDGWGTAWHGPEGLEASRVPGAGHVDPVLERMLERDAAAARLVHLRLATRGMACTADNTHPFTDDGLAFAHNGSVPTDGPLERLVSPARAAGLTGTTDSERYFAAIRSRMDEGASAVEAAAATAAALREAFPTRSANALLLTPRELIAVHASDGVPVPLHEFRASGLTSAELPRHHEEGYYLLRWRRTEEGGVLVASTGLDPAGWAALPAESVTRIDLATLDLETTPLAAEAARLVA